MRTLCALSPMLALHPTLQCTDVAAAAACVARSHPHGDSAGLFGHVLPACRRGWAQRRAHAVRGAPGPLAHRDEPVRACVRLCALLMPSSMPPALQAGAVFFVTMSALGSMRCWPLVLQTWTGLHAAELAAAARHVHAMCFLQPPIMDHECVACMLRPLVTLRAGAWRWRRSVVFSSARRARCWPTLRPSSRTWRRRWRS